MNFILFKKVQVSSITSLFLALGLCTSVAHAGIYVEPYLGYSSTDFKSGSSDSEKNNAAGMGYGMKLGYSMLGLGFGLDYSSSNMTTDKSPKYDLKTTDVGIFVGYTLPILLKAQASYFFSSKIVTDTNPEATYTGSGMKIGAGYTGLPFVALNFDYFTTSFSKRKYNGATTTLSPKADINGFMISVSLPFNL